MKITELDYPLPADLIAQEPILERDKARLLVLHKKNRTDRAQNFFYEITNYFQEGDMLIINNTKVIPARLVGRKPTGGKIEILLIKQKKALSNEVEWEIMTKGKYEGDVFIDDIKAEIRINCDGKKIIFFL